MVATDKVCYYTPWTARPVAERPPAGVETIQDADLSPGHLERLVWEAHVEYVEGPDGEWAKPGLGWAVYGSGMVRPAEPDSIDWTGGEQLYDGSAQVCTVPSPHVGIGSPPSAAAIALRIAECVNAMEGIEDPMLALQYVKSLLRHLASNSATEAEILVCAKSLAVPVQRKARQ